MRHSTSSNFAKNLKRFSDLNNPEIKNAYKELIRQRDEIKNKKQYNIYQLLMGQGKTSVIAPLLMINLLLDPSISQSKIIFMMPKHLVFQSSKLLSKYIPILNQITFICTQGDSRILLNVSRNINSSLTFGKNKFVDIFNNNEKKVLILDDDSMKILKLNDIENNTKFTSSITACVM